MGVFLSGLSKNPPLRCVQLGLRGRMNQYIIQIDCHILTSFCSQWQGIYFSHLDVLNPSICCFPAVTSPPTLEQPPWEGRGTNAVLRWWRVCDRKSWMLKLPHHIFPKTQLKLDIRFLHRKHRLRLLMLSKKTTKRQKDSTFLSQSDRWFVYPHRRGYKTLT